MRIAIMQPYFLPYFGYFQLINAVDRFVILDDVNYIKQGWINRNQIPTEKNNTNAGSQWLTVPVKNASQNRLIQDVEICSGERWKHKMRRTISRTYGHSHIADMMYSRIDGWLRDASGNLSQFLTATISDVAKLCGITTQIVPTSSIHPKRGLKGTRRILDICRKENASTYVNLPGGRGLYSNDEFHATGIQLSFLEPSLVDSVKRTGDGRTVFSILDQLMLNAGESLCDLVQPAAVKDCTTVVSPAA